MKRLLCGVFAAALFACGPLHASGPEDTGSLVIKVMLRTGETLSGEVIEETVDKLVVRRIKTGKTIVLPQKDVLQKTVAPSEKDLIATEGFCPYVAWRCAQKVGSALRGKVIKVSDDGIVLSLGVQDGVVRGMRFDVYREGEAIRDPDTGKVLGYEQLRVGQVEVVEVESDYSLATPLRVPVPPEPLQIPGPPRPFVREISAREDHFPLIGVGYLVVAHEASRALALVPFRADSKDAQVQAQGLSARLLAALVDRDVFVVERERIRDVILELGLQHTALWDPETAATLGRQVGAKALLLGDVSTNPRTLPVQLRLVDVPTGQILWAVSHQAPREKGPQSGGPGTSAPARRPVGARPRKTTWLFDGRTFNGWIQSGGEWHIRSGWMIGRNQGEIRGLASCQTLLANEFDLALKARCTGGYVLVVLDDLARPGKGYHFALGYLFNKEIRVVGASGEPVYLRDGFRCAPGRIYNLKVSMRPDRSEFYVDGIRVCVVNETTPLDSQWRLKLGTHPGRDTSVAFSEVKVSQPER